jgi:hypothetical protein
MRLKYCREFLDAELKSRDLEWKIHRKEKCLARMALVCDFNGGVIIILCLLFYSNLQHDIKPHWWCKG